MCSFCFVVGLYENFTGQLYLSFEEEEICIFERARAHTLAHTACAQQHVPVSVCIDDCRRVCVCAIQTSSLLVIRRTKNVLCCQRATALKELNGDNSAVIKFPVYFLRSHLQVFLRYVALHQMPTNISLSLSLPLTLLLQLVFLTAALFFLFYAPYY